MSENFAEDEEILRQLTDPEDIEAFSNLMYHAHSRNQSAASFIREEPGRTSRKRIKQLCLKEKKKVLRDSLKGYFKRMWAR